VSAMGQMRALNALGYLSQVGAIASASGGSWLAVPWTFLPDTLGDTDLLGTYISDPATLGTSSGGAPGSNINDLPTTSALSPMTHLNFSAAGLSNSATGLFLDPWIAGARTWQVLIAERLLEPVGLWASGHEHLPIHFFIQDDSAGQAATALNGAGIPASFDVVRVANANAVTRPYYICTTSMKVTDNGGAPALAPVQATPWFTGVLGSNVGTDAQGASVGGGGVQSYAFNGRLREVSGTTASVEIKYALSLGDITGMSSAFFAETWELGAIVPKYECFPIASQEAAVGVNAFADGGNLENTSVNALLAYSDIDKILAFVNGGVAISISDDTLPVLIIDENIPPLFGFQPYQKGLGYQPYDVTADPVPAGTKKSGTVNKKWEMYRYNQAFSSSDFTALLAGMGSATTDGTFLQAGLKVQENAWFGIGGGRSVDIQWIQLTPSTAWRDLLTDDVGKAVDHKSGFPNISLTDTELHKDDINLMANYTGWVVSQLDISGWFS